MLWFYGHKVLHSDESPRVQCKNKNVEKAHFGTSGNRVKVDFLIFQKVNVNLILILLYKYDM